jgi:hypothetical protein
VLWTSITTMLLAALFFSAWIAVAFLNSLIMGKPGVAFAESGIDLHAGPMRSRSEFPGHPPGSVGARRSTPGQTWLLGFWCSG